MNIHTIDSFIPSYCVDNVARALQFGIQDQALETKIGPRKLPVLDAALEPSDMVVQSVEKACESAAFDTSSLQALVVVTQNGDGAETIPHVSAIAHGKLGLGTDVLAFDVGLGCSGYVYGLVILSGLMKQMGIERAALVTADPYSRIINPEDRSTSLLFGDAATTTILDPTGKWQVGHAILQTDGSKREHIKTVARTFEMNGRQVFSFAATQVPEQIRQLLTEVSLTEQDIDQYCIHQGSGAIVRAIAAKFPAVSDRFPCEMAETGNTVSSSIPLLLQPRLNDEGLRKLVLSGFGIGLSWGSMLIERVG